MAKFHYTDSPSLSEKSAFKKYLSEDEELVLVTGLSSAYLRQEFLIYYAFPGMLIGLVVAGVAWFLGLDKVWAAVIFIILPLFITSIKTWHLHHANRYIITTRRLMIKEGFFSVKLSAILYDKITHIEVDQSLFDRWLLHHGNIIINTAGQNRNETVLKFVDYPLEIKNLLERLINREREHFGARSGSISSIDGEIIE